MKKSFFILAAITAMAILPAKAQFDETNNLFYHTMRTPQSNLYNPAFFPIKTSFYFMLPGIDFQFGSPLAMTDVLHYDANTKTTVISLDSILNCLDKNNKFRLGANINIFGFGIKIHNTFVSFNTRLVNHASLGIPTSIIHAFEEGNMVDDTTTRPVVKLLDGDVFNATSYLETGIGVAHHFEPIHLTVGLRAKLLYGVLNMQTDNTRLEINTSSEMDSVTARMYYEVQSASCAPYDEATKSFNISVSDLFNLGKANTGISFDLGAKYDYGPFTFSFAINDLTAGIHWKNNVMTWRPEGGQGVIEFTGLELSNMLDNGNLNTDSLTAYLEERLNGMTPTSVDSGDYWFSIPTKIDLGASYSFAKLLRAGILFHGQFDRGLLCKSNDLALDLNEKVTNTFRWNTTLTIGANLYNWVEVILGSSIVYDGESMDFFNPGAGLILTPGKVVQLYLLADYISSFYLTDSKAFNIKFGLNILI